MPVKSISLKVLYMNCNILIYILLWMMFQLLMYVSTDQARFIFILMYVLLCGFNYCFVVVYLC